MFSVEFTNKNGIPADKALKIAIERYTKSRNKELYKALEQSAIRVEGKTKRNISVWKSSFDKLIDTGRMINNITHETIEKSKEMYALVGTNLFYTKFHELGTSKIPARPFLRPAFISEKKWIVKTIKTAVNKSGKKVSK